MSDYHEKRAAFADTIRDVSSQEKMDALKRDRRERIATACLAAHHH